MRKPWIKQPPHDITQLGRDLGYGLKEITKLKEAKGEDKLRREWQSKWRRYKRESLRLLDQNPAREPTSDTSRAARLPGGLEPEMVSEEIEDEYAKQARERDVARWADEEAEARARPLEERLRIVRAQARQSGVDLGRIEASLERRIRAAENKLKQTG